MSKFQAYSDPGHAWVKVPRSLLVKLGIEDQISAFSYERGDMAYLEEDMDYSLFARTMRESGRTVELKINNTNRSSKIRSYSNYKSRK